jgi:alpha-mannosidase
MKSHFRVAAIVVCLAAGMSGPAIPAEGQGIHVVPQSHIDVAWFWRYDPETIEVCIPMTFGRAVEALERFPDYVFVASQVPLYEGLRRNYPDLAAKVARYVREGRWEIVGGHVVEYEGTGPSGEAIVRQCVYGKRYFKDVWGIDVRHAWQPDSWTHPWTVPQILRKCEMETYCFLRGFRGENVFWWESPDGSRVLACRPASTSDDIKPAIQLARETQAKYGVNLSMWIAGSGDHGGGLNVGAIEKLRRDMAASPVPARFSRYDRFVAALLKTGKDWPVLKDELGFELEGCQSNAGPLKAANRLCENLLVETEKFSTLAERLAGLAYPKESLKAGWFDVMHNQFHDTISGCVIPAGYQDALDLYAGVERIARRHRQAALDRLVGAIDTRGKGEPVVVFNSLSWSRTGPVQLELTLKTRPDAVEFVDAGGQAAQGQILQTVREGGAWLVRCVFVAHNVPGIGCKTYHARPTPARPVPAGAPRGGDWELENGSFALKFDPGTGDLVGIIDKRISRQILSAGQHGNRIDILEETGDSEGRLAWGNKTWKPEPPEKINGWRIVEQGPVRTTVRVRNVLWRLHTAFDRFVTLYHDVPWIEFRTHIEWNSSGKYVKLAFPTPYRQARPTFEIPYGTIARDPDGQQRPALNWVDLGDAEGGVSLLNDCRNGHDVKDGVIRIDAIRSPVEPAHNTECGNQTLTYALYPHAGDWRRGATMRRGHEFNNPLVGVQTALHQGRFPSSSVLLTVDAPNVILAVAKQAEDSKALVLRLYEIHGQKCTATIQLRDLHATRAVLTNMLERPVADLTVKSGTGEFQSVEVPMGAYEINTFAIE